MLAFFTSFLLLAEAAHGSQPAWLETYNKYLNYPGFEGWKFLNLAIFVGILVYLLKKPLSAAFKAKRESIRAALIKAEAEKQAALKTLAETDSKLAGLEAEKSAILQQASDEAAAEKLRINEQAAAETRKLREQAEAEIDRLAKLNRHDLKKFAAEESIRLAEAKLRSNIDAAADAKLVDAGIKAVGGLK